MTSEKLHRIQGVVSDLVVHGGEEEFLRCASQQAVRVGAAAGLAATGLAGVAAAASIAATSAGDAVEFFVCKVGGETAAGRFSKVSFKEGDEIEMYRADPGPNGLILAARRRSDSLILMAPHCSRGVQAHRAFSLKLFLWLMVLGPVYGVGMYLVLGVWLGGNPLELSEMYFPSALATALGWIVAAHFSVRFYRQWLPTARQAEGIFSSLGYINPSCVDLERDHKLYCQARGIKWPYPSEGPWIYHYLDEALSDDRCGRGPQ